MMDYGMGRQSRASRELSSDPMLQARNAKFLIVEETGSAKFSNAFGEY